MTRVLAAGAILLSLTAGGGRAGAAAGDDKPDDPPPHERRPLPPSPRPAYLPREAPPPSTAVEPVVAIAQGILAGLVPIVAVFQMERDLSSRRSLIVVAATPLVMGSVVCAVGSASDRRRGSCLSSIGGAYLATAAGAALILGAYQLDLATENPEGDVHIPGFTLVAVLLGWFALPAATSVGFWHIFSHPRPGLDGPVLNPPPLPPPPRPAFAPERPRGPAPAPGQGVLQVLSVGF